MLILHTKKMELRGIHSKVSQKTQKPYYVVYCEDGETAEPHQFICRDFNALQQGLKKSDHVILTVQYNNFKEFDILKVEKVD